MPEVKLNSREGEPRSFEIFDEDGVVGEMILELIGSDLTIYHTEVDPEKEGRGYAKMLLDHMVSYVRENGLKVIPLCPYVHAQFQRHQKIYDDIWNKINE